MTSTVGKDLFSLNLQPTDMISSSLAISLSLSFYLPHTFSLTLSLGSHINVFMAPMLREFIFEFVVCLVP